MTIQEALYYATTQLTPLYLQDERASIAHWIVSWVTGLTSAELISHKKDDLSDEQQALLKKTLHEHVDEHKPLQYIVGTVPFLSLTLTVRPPILIPRPETEYWCWYLIKKLEKLKNPKIRILDMCTGSGCIAISLAQALPQATVTAVDISLEACDLAAENSKKNKVPLTIIQSDLFTQLQPQKFDLIVSNPPYISQEEWPHLPLSVKAWESPQALIAADHGLELLKTIIMQAPLWLKENNEMEELHIPQLVVEIGHEQGKLVQDIFIKAGLALSEIHKDLSGNDRFVTGEFHAIRTISKTYNSLS